MADIFVRYVDFPRTVRGVTLPNDDGTFSVYLNAILTETMQRKTLAHELAHIRMNHFYDCEPVIVNEREASGGGIAADAAHNVPPIEPPVPLDMDGDLSLSPPNRPAPDRASALELEQPSGGAVSPTAIAQDAPSPACAQEVAVPATVKPHTAPRKLGRLTPAARARLGRRDRSALSSWEEKQLYPGG